MNGKNLQKGWVLELQEMLNRMKQKAEMLGSSEKWGSNLRVALVEYHIGRAKGAATSGSILPRF